MSVLTPFRWPWGRIDNHVLIALSILNDLKLRNLFERVPHVKFTKLVAPFFF